MPRRRKDAAIAPAASALEEDIIFGRLRPLARLTEEDLMGRFELTRHLSRRVLQQLEGLGLVTSDSTGGTMVRAFGLDEIEHIYEIRHVLQDCAMRRMPLPAPAEFVAQLLQIHKRHLAAVRRNDLSAIFRTNEELHDAIFLACGNPVLAGAIKRYAWLTHGIRSRLFADPVHLKRAAVEHLRLITALERGDRQGLVEINRAHVSRPKTAYIALQRAIDLDTATHGEENAMVKSSTRTGVSRRET